MIAGVPAMRVETLSDRPIRPDGQFVLYWMIAQRRTHSNFSLQRAVEHAQRLEKPLLVLEALRCDYPWACDRLHQFFIDGMADNARRLAGTGVGYYAYLEPRRGAGKGLLAELSRLACLIVTDHFPCTFLPRMVKAAADQSTCRFEQVDSCGILPLRAASTVFPTAFAFRRFLHRELRPHLDRFPEPEPLARIHFPPFKELPASITQRWPRVDAALFNGAPANIGDLPIDHAIKPVDGLRGGHSAARKALAHFLVKRLNRYANERSEPCSDAASGLSPYLHFGHLSTHEIVHAIFERARWTPEKLAQNGAGRKEGWWNLDPASESFLDELITWRELGFNMTWQRDDYDQFESLPDWARQTLIKHAKDPREHLYSLEEFDQAGTHDPLWNAAQNQLRRDGRIHNYVRMLWGKKILEWSASPQDALQIMIELNNRYAVDGRNPNSYSGIGWVLGRYDRPWGPERPIFGTVRYMSSANTARKFDITEYIARYS